MYHESLFIFRRSFRLKDNTALINALKNSDQVICAFILTPEQLITNSYKSDNCVQFMMESLKELEEEIKKKKGRLCYFMGKQDEVVEKIIKKEKINAVYVNQDYTPYATKRDKKIEKVCQKHDVAFHSYEDYLVNPVGSIRTGSDTVYTKFTPYWRKATKVKVPKPKNNNHKNYSKTKMKGEFTGGLDQFYEFNENLAVNGGRKNALKILKDIKEFKDYNKERNTLNIETTRLSAYIKFGCISIREAYHVFKDKLGAKNDLLKQLYWRDFYYNISYFYPHVFGNAMKEKYDKIKWKNNSTWFKKWKEGKTGFPIVDAGMREMNETGFMHNRSRLIVSNFLIKLLQIDWQKGEKYFAQTLVDYDPNVNNGNWQWGAGSGADSQPYFRVFNPWLQSKKFDKDAEYIKMWVPELEDVPQKALHKWEDHYKDFDVDYPEPMIDYKKQREKAGKMYDNVFD